jgi:type I restriction enzyme S subunit
MQNNKTLPKNWKKVKLSDIGTLRGGVTSIKPDDYGFGTPFITYMNVFKNPKIDINNLQLMNVPTKDIERFGCSYGDIFFTASSETYKEIGMSSVLLDEVDNLTFNGFCKRFRLNNFNTLLPLYARYLFRSPQFRHVIISKGTGDIRFNLSQQSLGEIEILLPDTRSQKNIIEILSAFDNKIELNNKINQNLEQTAQAIFREWLLKNQKSNFKNQKLEMTCDIVYGKDLPTKDLKKTGFPVYGGNGVIGYSQKILYDEPQIIVGCRGAYSGNIFKTEPKNFITHNSLVLKIKDGRGIGINYLFYALQKSNVKSSITGSAQPQITIAELNKVEIPILDERLMQEFEAIASIIEDHKYNIVKENQKLVALRDLLLPKLMSGEIKV